MAREKRASMFNTYRVEIKYGLITLVLLGSMFVLKQSQALSRLDSVFDHFFNLMSGLGFVGMFIAAVIGNSTLLIQVPHTMLLLPLALGGASLIRMTLMAIVAAIGAVVGELISYTLALKILGSNSELENSPLFQWVKRTVNSHRWITPILVFIWAASPLPDDTVIIPLAMARYSMARMLLPLIAGKVFHNLVTAAAFYYFTDGVTALVSTSFQVDLAFGILIVFVVLIFYQVEKTRTAKPAFT